MMKSSQNIISGVFETLWNNVMIIMLPFYIVPYLPVYKFGRMNLHLFVAGIEGIYKQIDHICCFVSYCYSSFKSNKAETFKSRFYLAIFHVYYPH